MKIKRDLPIMVMATITITIASSQLLTERNMVTRYPASLSSDNNVTITKQIKVTKQEIFFKNNDNNITNSDQNTTQVILELPETNSTNENSAELTPQTAEDSKVEATENEENNSEVAQQNAEESKVEATENEDNNSEVAQQNTEENKVEATENEENNSEVAQTAKEEAQESDDKAMLCVDEKEYNNLIQELDDLKDRMKTIASVIPSEYIPKSNNESNESMTLAQMFQLMSLMNQNNNQNPYMMQQPMWNAYMPQGLYSNNPFQMQQSMPNPYQFTLADQALYSRYTPYNSPLTINNYNYYYGQSGAATQQNRSLESYGLPTNYFTPEMNFGGLNTVNFQNGGARNPANTQIPSGYFNF